mmetsp:Transcript_213/g.299  ORF Transcript_213/g.299 Transcript_213/m.299 type:complete len:229 (-) Transcript_213:315-1001(-)
MSQLESLFDGIERSQYNVMGNHGSRTRQGTSIGCYVTILVQCGRLDNLVRGKVQGVCRNASHENGLHASPQSRHARCVDCSRCGRTPQGGSCRRCCCRISTSGRLERQRLRHELSNRLNHTQIALHHFCVCSRLLQHGRRRFTTTTHRAVAGTTTTHQSRIDGLGSRRSRRVVVNPVEMARRTHLNVRSDGIQGIHESVFRDSGQGAGYAMDPKRRGSIPFVDIHIKG